MNLSGRGDKDMGTAIEWFGLGETRPDDEAGCPRARRARGRATTPQEPQA